MLNKNKGFYLERAHIFIFEVLPAKISNTIVTANKYVLKFLFRPFLYVANLVINAFAIKYLKDSKIKMLRNVFFVFGIFIVFIIIIILFLFGGIYFG